MQIRRQQYLSGCMARQLFEEAQTFMTSPVSRPLSRVPVEGAEERHQSDRLKILRPALPGQRGGDECMIG